MGDRSWGWSVVSGDSRRCAVGLECRLGHQTRWGSSPSLWWTENTLCIVNIPVEVVCESQGSRMRPVGTGGGATAIRWGTYLGLPSSSLPVLLIPPSWLPLCMVQDIVDHVGCGCVRLTKVWWQVVAGGFAGNHGAHW